MTWGEFNAAVRIHLPSHNRRQGIQPLIDSLIKAAVWDLQAGIVEYRANTKRTIKPASIRPAGLAGQASLAPNVRIVAAYAVDPADDSVRVPYSISKTADQSLRLIEGNVPANEKWLHYNSQAGVVTLCPSPKEDNSNTLLVLDAKQLDFETEDDVPFELQTAKVVGDYVSAHLARTIDHDLGMAQSFNGSYLGGKRLLRSELNGAALLPAEGKES